MTFALVAADSVDTIRDFEVTMVEAQTLVGIFTAELVFSFKPSFTLATKRTNTVYTICVFFTRVVLTFIDIDT